jgi:hypothetical protein
VRKIWGSLQNMENLGEKIVIDAVTEKLLDKNFFF